jgi:dGTPase
MIRKRKDIEQIEQETLADYAMKSRESKGRKYPEKEADDRTCFQRDRDRILYSKSFMRLRGKTQVVLAGHGDHFRTRLDHTQYVATVGRSISQSLGLNQDLAEAIALSHDLGHTCFGHEGESTLNEMMKKYGEKFEHNEQSLWVVERLEVKSKNYEGLNLTFEVRDGIDKHRTAYDNPESKNSVMPTLEAQVVNVADEIAYNFHDLDDGMRAEVFSESDLNGLKIWKAAKKELEKGESDLPYNIRSKIMEFMIDDLIGTTEDNLKKNGIHSVSDVYSCAKPLVHFSMPMNAMISELKAFLYNKFYKSEDVRNYNQKGRKIITFLFEKFYNKPELMPVEFTKRLKKSSGEKHIVVKDYMAGMTDGFAIALYNQLKD